MNFFDIFNIKREFFNLRNIFIIMVGFVVTFIIFASIKEAYSAFELHKIFVLRIASFYQAYFLPTFLLLLFMCVYVLLGFVVPQVPWFCRGESNFSFDESTISKEFIDKNFDFQGFIDDVYDGRKCLYLTSSPEGLISKKYFKNYKIKFVANMIKGNTFGIILKARELENYFMFNIGFDNKTNLLHVVPHVRKNGIWDVQRGRNKQWETNRIEDGLCSFEIICKDGVIKILILRDKREIIKADYKLPQRFPLLGTHLEDADGFKRNVVANIDWPKRSKVGFRAYYNEKAIIYNWKIEEVEDA